MIFGEKVPGKIPGFPEKKDEKKKKPNSYPDITGIFRFKTFVYFRTQIQEAFMCALIKMKY